MSGTWYPTNGFITVNQPFVARFVTPVGDAGYRQVQTHANQGLIGPLKAYF